MSEFTDAIKQLNTKGPLMPKVKLTKKRALILLDMIHRYRHEWNFNHEEGHHLENEMQSAVNWLSNQIFKRWSQNDLYSG